jgi:hypothetical protein
MTRPHPQRIFAPSAPGSLLKRAGDEAARPRKDDGEKDGAYLANVRACPCLVCGLDPCGEAAHVRFASAAFGKASGLNKKPPDRFSLPVCGDDHRIAKTAQHNRNEHEFWASLGIQPLPLCAELYAKRGDLVAMRMVVMVAISQRSKQV